MIYRYPARVAQVFSLDAKSTLEIKTLPVEAWPQEDTSGKFSYRLVAMNKSPYDRQAICKDLETQTKMRYTLMHACQPLISGADSCFDIIQALEVPLL
jgi:hypothetical protein